jgi:hypothetical protein
LVGKITPNQGHAETFEVVHGLDFETCTSDWSNLKLKLARNTLTIELNEKRLKSHEHKLRLPEGIACKLYIGGVPGKLS